MTGEATLPNPTADAPIGLFDSGLGGLTVARQLQKMLPYERVVYVADQAHVPYGGRDLAEVSGFAHGITDTLLRYGCKAVVMACNISTATALTDVQSLYPHSDVLGVIEPGVLEALRTTRNGRVGVLTTEGTRCTGAYTRTIHRQDARVFVLEVGCPDFVPLVEAGEEASELAFAACTRYLAPLQEAAIDTVILGCTHYPFLLPLLMRIAPDILFVDPALSTIHRLMERLTACNILATAIGGGHLLTTTGDVNLFKAQLARFLPEAIGNACVAQSNWQLGRLCLLT